jgi:glycosyltransferase involved in cell wall biosynthesis
MPRVKVLYVFGGEKAQGAEIVIERLMSYNLQNIDSHLFVSPGRFADNLLSDNKPYKITVVDRLRKLYRSSNSKMKFYNTALVNYFSVSYKVYRYIKENKIGIVHSNTIVPASYLIPAIIFSKITFSKVKWIWSDHDLNYYSKVDHFLSRICAALYHNTIVVSNAVKNKFGENKKVRLLYNGLDLNLFKPNPEIRDQFRKSLSIASDSFVIGMPAVTSPIKGQLALIEVFKKLRQKYSNVILLLAGGFAHDTPDYTQKVKEAINQNDSIFHLGFITNVADFYSGCDVIVSNSNLTGSEPLGTSIIEAMACQKIVIASNTGGTPEIISDGIDGLLFTPENMEELKTVLENVISNHSSFLQFGILAREKVEFKFNIAGMLTEYNKIVAQL